MKALVCSLLMVVAVSATDCHVPVNHEVSIAVCSEQPETESLQVND